MNVMTFLQALVDDYVKNQYSQEQLKSLGYYTTLKDNPQEFCHKIAYAITSDGTTHFHQRRLNLKTKAALEQYLMELFPELTSVNDFDELKRRVHLKGMGDLAAYDTALRIGHTIGVYPKKFYFHRGAKEGYKNLCGPQKVRGRNCTDMAELPEELQMLEPIDVENFFCIYKDDIAERRLIRSKASCNGKTPITKPYKC